MKPLIPILLVIPLLSFAQRADYEQAAFSVVLEAAALDEAALEAEAFNAVSNAIEFAIWSLEQRKSVASTRALVSLIEVRLGAAHTRDVDCAIMARGVSALPLLSGYASRPSLQRCTSIAEERGISPERACKALDDAKQSAVALANAIKQGRRCEN